MLVAVALALGAPAAHGFGHHGPSSITGTVPAGGTLSASSPTLPKSARTASITAEPADAASAPFFDKLTEVISAGPTRGKRVLTCIALYAFAVQALPSEDVSFDGTDPVLAQLFLRACLQIALAVPAPGAGARAAAVGCAGTGLGAPMRLARRGGRYELQVAGRVGRATGPLRVSCRRVGRGIRLRLSTRSRRRTLRQVVGTKLAIAYANPATGRAVKVRTTFGD